MRLDALSLQPFADAGQHLAAELRWLDGRLAAHVRRLREEGRYNDDPMRGLYVRGEDVLGDLDRHPASPTLPDRLRATIDARAELSPVPPLARIARAARLNPIAQRALLIVAAPALDRRYRTAFAFAQNDVARGWPTIDLLIELLCPDDRLAALAMFAPSASLRAQALIHVVAGEEDRPLADRALGIDDRVVHALAGLGTGPDHRLAPFVTPAPALDPGFMLPALPMAAQLIVVEGDGDAGQRTIAARWAREMGRSLLTIDGATALASGLTPARLAQLLAREATLDEAALFVDMRDADQPPGAVEETMVAIGGTGVPTVIAVGRNAIDGRRLGTACRPVHVALDTPAPARRVTWWRHAIGDSGAADRLGWSTRLGADAIAAHHGASATEASAAVATHAARRLPPVMRHVTARWRRDELIVSDAVLRQLDALAAFAAHRPRVIGDWGFGAGASEAGRCLALLSGPSGTGKTMGASIVAAAAGIPLYRVNLATVFDKYIGGTEKQIDRLFGAAADAGVALLFDEADVLFGARTEVRDSHDRYANLSTAYILQRVEEHEGLVLLSSNLPANMDDAFARRLSHTISFALPDASQRRRLWARAFPATAPLDPMIDWEEIAETFELSGGHIRNAAIGAAYLAAADADTDGIRLDHVLRAVARELEKTGRTPIAADFGRLALPD